MIQSPPTPTNGTPASTLVDASTMKILDGAQYINDRKKAMLNGQVYVPTVAAVPLQYVAGKPSTAYDPYYGGLSPRIGVAWNPHPTSGIMKTLLGDKKTTIRANYGIVYGRINAIRTYSSTMQLPGIMQTVTCTGPSINGQCTGIQRRHAQHGIPRRPGRAECSAPGRFPGVA